MKTETVVCDNCRKDITYTGNCEDYRIVLQSESIPKKPGQNAFTLMGVHPQFSRAAHFCGTKCLKELVAKL